MVGDSRIYAGFNPAIATSAAGGATRFLNGGVPGTTPRCWFFFLRAVDPGTRRFRAIVIPVDTYGDDDSAIGSLDGDRREMDLHYIVFRVRPADIPKLARSFGDARARLNVATDLALRAPILRDDVQSFAQDPAARMRAIARVRLSNPWDPRAAHPRTGSLSGLRTDFRRNVIDFPKSVPSGERDAIATQILNAVHSSPSYAVYRTRWLGPIVERYAAAGVPVIFVRIPARPAHRSAISNVGASLRRFAGEGARLVDPSPYIALERPALFADHDHLDAAGSADFSRLLGADVARLLRTSATFGRDPAAPSAGRSDSFFQGLHTLLGIGIPLPFQSYEFWLFFAVSVAVFYGVRPRLRRGVLLIASYYFYARWNGWYVVFLLVLTVSDYAIAIAVERFAGRARRFALFAGVAANLAFLGAFKYANLATSTVAALVGMHANPWLVRLFVPIGISFHTFQSISYLADVYRGKLRPIRNVFDYALYLAFFPQLLAGPIVRAGLFFGELFSWKKPTAEDVAYGCMRVAFGLVKKTCIADQFAPASDAYFGSVGSHPGALAAAGAVFAFSMQIYFDFSGYSDIAIGCARIFGFVFPENFAQPYLATSITDFWHRWHVTLSTWLRDYVYIPLGGNRDGAAATLRNLMFTMLLGGLWHGAQWTFVAWGAYHGVLLCIERVFGIGRSAGRLNGGLALVRICATFVAVSLGWVLFRAPGFSAAAQVYGQLFAGGFHGWLLGTWQTELGAGLILFAVARTLVLRMRPALSWPSLTPAAQAGILCALLFAVALFSWPGAPATFIYFKF